MRPEISISRDTALTISTRFVSLLGGLGLLILTTHLFGTEGRGEIALILTNVGIIATLANVFCGSTVTFHSQVLKKEILFASAFLWALIVALTGSLGFAAIFGFKYLSPLFFLSLLVSIGAFFNSYFLGKQRIGYYNLLTLLPSLLIFVSLAIIQSLSRGNSVESYFYAAYSGYSLVLLIGILLFFRKGKPFISSFSFNEIKPVFLYGIKNEFNYFIQLLNYRLSYYIIAFYISLSDLGIFSVVVSVSESAWIISRSISSLHYSNVVNNPDSAKTISQTRILARQSLIISSVFMFLVVLIPSEIFTGIFGPGFDSTGNLIFMLVPGIIAIAFSNIHGHYFAGIGKLNVLRNKSLIGLLSSMIFLSLLVPYYNLKGACIAMDISYLASSVYLWIMFRKEVNTVKKCMKEPDQKFPQI